MKDIKTTCKIALVQAEPVMFSKSASLKKALQYICEAASQKPDLIVFPELFIPGYPVGMNFGFSMGKRSDEGRKDWKRYYDASVVAGDSEFQQLAEAAKKAEAYICYFNTCIFPMFFFMFSACRRRTAGRPPFTAKIRMVCPLKALHCTSVSPPRRNILPNRLLSR